MSFTRACAWCSADITSRQADALYCSKRCGNNAASRAFRARNPGYYSRWRYPGKRDADRRRRAAQG